MNIKLCVPAVSTIALLGISACQNPLNLAPGYAYSPIIDEQTADFLRSAPLVAPSNIEIAREKYFRDQQVFGLSISGGGARAAAYTLGVLAGLEEIEPPRDWEGGAKSALEAVDFASSTSGGSWGLAAYLGDRFVQSTNDQSASSYSLSEARPRISKRLADFSKVGNRDGRYRAFAETIAQNVTFGQIGEAGLPDPFFNITLMPAQAPFVFTEAYLDHYSVESFVISERTKVPVKNVDPLSDLPIGLAAVISGYVPGWYHSYAETGLCSSTPLKNGSLCRNGASVDKLSLVDGGLYDNYGYKSAFELFASIDPDRKAKRLLIQIDVTTNLPFHTSASKKPPGAAGILRSLSFANQDASFLKGFQLFAGQMEIDTVVLDLYSTAKFDPDTQSELVADLSALRSIAGNLDPWCDAHVCRPDENDAARNNFWRVGLHGRTSFLSDYQPEDGAEGDKGLFTATWQLGVLAVRMHSDEISCSLYDVDTNGDSCAA